MADSQQRVTRQLMNSPQRFLNRELSWLEFNRRVLEEADNRAHPLLERLRFLSISASNLDEFDMVRYAGLREQVRAGVSRLSQDGLTPAQQVDAVEMAAFKLISDQQSQWRALKAAMEDEGIFVLSPGDLTKRERADIEAYFHSNIFPVLTPLAIDPAHPFPFIPNLGFTIAFDLEPLSGGETQVGIVPMPSFVRRFIRLPKGQKPGIRFIALEDVIGLFLPAMFPGFKESGRCLFRIVRDSDIEIEEESEDLIREFEVLLKQRRRGRIVRLRMQSSAPERLRIFIMREIGADSSDVVLYDGILGMTRLSELIVDDRPDLLFPPHEPRYPERIREMGGDILAAIRAKDILVHHPFESFDVVVEFVRQAAADPQVVAIKQTLYRTTVNSPIVGALIEAAESGKSVTALVEIKARFDEEANLRLARDLERAGVQVVYGFIEYKTHAKVSLVVRREGNELRTYTHFGTGNYHPTNARIYTDLSLFTADQALGRDANRLFNYVTANREPPEVAPEFESICMAPVNLKEQLLVMIEAEAAAARKKRPSGIWAKMNSLVDGDVIDALYRASQAGVPIHLVVRGICCLRPGIAGLSENITVKSIVGRFLEHARMLCFANGEALPSANAKVFMSSADWMPRNLLRRVEVLVPIQNPTVHRQVMNQIMVANLNDASQSWLMHPDGTYERLVSATPEAAFSAHGYFMSNPSLSGRGSALEVTLPPRLSLPEGPR
ncbi:MAG: RNA degradosome polyphosphate kinase [Hyphomonas sp.]|uniref:RNA degradosome polyphosphate kinase n=1 Tax=Hyphomonas sp. TaxID=87 RepID=UPI001803DC90|nr:RNA degradosome polyphosphate kinase [Hyphomonas sp.]MBA3070075.1 RNA degradosome polyphosphate kinase [Hyphomonas sp.]MBU3921326.1 RNA degradosome polyphosphate kinase [Alphaproteobacteria bacterium]MBU4060349.1 RNA degradosome polyphosphate kinase [Alphaproteobacteria bacterium]MBU4163017.1 RNA degradosome polyphosphate kinase [Alphaproteobacteria bacterium]